MRSTHLACWRCTLNFDGAAVFTVEGRWPDQRGELYIRCSRQLLKNDATQVWIPHRES